MRAEQIDVILKFTSLDEARADPIVQRYYDAAAGQFAADRVISGLQVWRASQDVGGAHTYLPGWYMLISFETGHLPDALRDHAAAVLVVNRDKASCREPGGVIRQTVSKAVLQDLRFQPVFAGFDPPFGTWQ